MISIDEAYVESAAPNADATKNGRGLVVKGKFAALNVDADETILFGKCQGSGKEPYACSCDFARPEQPTHRCTCPSRQFPCKHCVGLMLAWVLKRASFKTADVPPDIAEKREKLATRVEKKKEEATKPKVVNKDALAKKIKAQLDGLDLLEKLTLDLTRLGIGNTSAKSAKEIEEKAKQLGNAYLPGAQAALHRYTKLFGDEAGAFDPKAPGARGEAIFSEALDQLSRLHSLVKQGRAYLNRRLEDPELKPETDSAIAAWLGHAWQLAELKSCGLVRADAELIQLAFNSHDDVARQEYVDTGVWMDLGTGRVHVTQNFRPYKAVKYIKSDDSFFQVAQVKEMCVYPGDVNPRVRWEGMLPRPVEPKDYQRVREHARSDFAAVVKEVKGNLKAPLADKQPIYALRFKRIGQVDGVPVVEDAKGERLAMTDAGMSEEPASCHLLQLLPPGLFENQVVVARFRHDLDTRKLRVKPLSIVTETGVVRLTL
ncbi:MAG TPA: SWIM zinc finger family protein [Tepidisphaeraceae bacterium]|nr:SWIM zinc finger family protein [Tepidisphaeraceae bacterium]